MDAAAVVVDVIDTRTNKLIFRNFAKRSVAPGASEATWQAGINEAVAQALAPFFE